MHYACNKNLFLGFTFALTEEGALNGAMNWTFISSRNPSFQLTDTGFPRTFFYVRAALLVTDRRWTLQPSKSPYSGFVLGLMLRNQTLSSLLQVFMILKSYLQWDVALEPHQEYTKAPTGALFIAILPCHMIASPCHTWQSITVTTVTRFPH